MKVKGFTLIEVLTTVVIIGVLASIAMPMYMRAVERSRATEAMAAVKAPFSLLIAYKIASVKSFNSSASKHEVIANMVKLLTGLNLYSL